MDNLDNIVTKERVVVFGGSGFMGSHVVDQLTLKGYKVVVFDRTSSPYITNKQQMVVGDLSNFKQVGDCVQGADYVFHFGGIADIHEAKENPLKTVSINILGTTNILEACRIHKVKKFIFASTLYVYSEIGSFYRSTKQACELLIENYKSEFNLDFCILRFGSLYGRRANKFNYIGKVINQALLEGIINRKGDGSEIRDYIHVEDAARASVKVLEHKFNNKYVLITGNQKFAIREILEMIQEMFLGKVDINFDKKKIMEGHYQFTPYSFKPRVALKYIPELQHDLGQGILDVIYDTYKKLIKEGYDIKIPIEEKNNKT